jgi:hypothetical protein
MSGILEMIKRLQFYRLVTEFEQQKAACKTIFPDGNAAGVSGYCLSRYSAILKDSETVAPVVESVMAGAVYRMLPSRLVIGGTLACWSVGFLSISSGFRVLF